VRAPDVSVIVLAYGDEPLLATCVDAVLASELGEQGRQLELLVVDNGSPAVARLEPRPGLRVLAMPENTGYAGGCDVGAAEARGCFLVFLNSDAVVEVRAIGALVARLADPAVGLACGSVRLIDRPDLVNAVGNPVHLVGLVTAGGFGEPAVSHATTRDVASVTGAFFGCHRQTWEELGGFDPTYFAYHEDVELSLRCWQRGRRVVFEPAAVATHDYAFSRNPRKQYLLERNRWLTLLTVYPAPVLWAVLPLLVAFEVAVCGLALVQGWLPEKLQGYRWLLSHGRGIMSRRAQVQRESALGAGAFADLLTSRLTTGALGEVPGLGLVNAVVTAYWTVVRRLLR
jgi:GT2 family glycosyltransferase